MAYVAPRKNSSGEITSYQVKWRLGGGRTAPQQVERFKDEPSAEVFRDAVKAAGEQWPAGWVKGVGYVEEEDLDAQYVFDAYARASIAARTGIEEHYRHAILREYETYLKPTFGTADVRSPKDFCKRTVGAWVNAMAETMLWSGDKRKPMSPKTIRNLHGLLSSILKEATEEEPPLRARNPCELTALPRIDDDGVEAGDEDMTFLLPAEVEAIAVQFRVPEGAKLTRDKYATGARWGEISALARKHVFLEQSYGHPKVKIARAWKRKVGGGFYLGKPKSKRSRRTIRIPLSVWQGYLDAGLEDLGPEDLIYHNGQGDRLPYWMYYGWFMDAVERAHRAGTLPAEKHPTPHDLRHSHAAALISKGHSLTYVQRRLGHESITTTSDRYGHLLPQADDDAMETIEESLHPGGVPVGAVVLPAQAEAGDVRRVYVVHVGAEVEGFWDLDHAQAVAEQLEVDTGTPALVEAWSVQWWNRQVLHGVNKIRHRIPERVLVWSVGPAVYGPDGAEHVLRPEDHEPRSLMVWEWEELYTEEPAVRRAEWRPHGETTAEAWGLDRAAVVEAYGAARADALRVCSMNPALRAEGDRETAG
ncbi:site-specific integrase [Streptomyces sp. G1]|uniref:tyrosine-type recombinase/integrase n=1 Tax=Streptomyces sp. G1 TaxID=361572 RepID=UPI00202FE138|nr:site-specific integrase [Streptomyces sp. G1]MCM1964917.1 site-specific integrase [Streptomyces sp. G1]